MTIKEPEDWEKIPFRERKQQYKKVVYQYMEAMRRGESDYNRIEALTKRNAGMVRLIIHMAKRLGLEPPLISNGWDLGLRPARGEHWARELVKALDAHEEAEKNRARDAKTFETLFGPKPEAENNKE